MSREDSRRRVERAHQLRALGRSWQEIADSEGYRSRGAARTAVKNFTEGEPGESVEEVRRSAAETLRITRSILLGRVADATQRGDDDTLVKLSREVHRNLAQLAQLVGANAPARSEIELAVKSSPTSIVDQAERQLLATIDGEVIE